VVGHGLAHDEQEVEEGGGGVDSVERWRVRTDIVGRWRGEREDDELLEAADEEKVEKLPNATEAIPLPVIYPRANKE